MFVPGQIAWLKILTIQHHHRGLFDLCMYSCGKPAYVKSSYFATQWLSLNDSLIFLGLHFVIGKCKSSGCPVYE